MKKALVHRDSGNIFADLEVHHAGEYMAKSELAVRIFKIIKCRCLTQAAAGKVLGINQPKVSALMNGRLDACSTDRLFRFLTVLGRDVRIAVSPPHPKKVGKVRVLEG